MTEDELEEDEEDEVELTDEQLLLADLFATIAEALEEDDLLPFSLETVTTTRRGRPVAYFDWDLKDEDEEE